jgi:hypothetical protein
MTQVRYSYLMMLRVCSLLTDHSFSYIPLHKTGIQEVKWLKHQLQDKLQEQDLSESVKTDILTLLAVLQCPVFESILTIEVRLPTFLCGHQQRLHVNHEGNEKNSRKGMIPSLSSITHFTHCSFLMHNSD